MSYVSTVVRETTRWFHLAPKGLIRFICVGLGGLAVDQSVLFVAERLGASFSAARAIAIFVATFATWALNRRFTFAETGRPAHWEALRYFGVAFVAQSVNYGVSVLRAARYSELRHALTAFIGAVAGTVFSHSGQRFFTFAPHRSAKDEATRSRD
jgi:putative flippase GtrA